MEWHGTCLSTSALIGDALLNSPNPRQPQLTLGAHNARLQALASDFWPVPGPETAGTGENSDRKRCPESGLRTPRKFQPAPSAQTTSSAHGLGGRCSWPWACGVASSNRLALARRLRDSYVCQHSTNAGSARASPLLPRHLLPCLHHSPSVPPRNCPAASACI